MDRTIKEDEEVKEVDVEDLKSTIKSLEAVIDIIQKKLNYYEWKDTSHLEVV